MASTTAPEKPPKAPRGRRRSRNTRLGARDRAVLGVMIGIPALIHIALVWLPALGSVLLSFTRWDGIGGFDTIEWVGFENYDNVFTNYPPFEPALKNNLIWLIFFLIVPTTFGLFLAVQLDKNIKGSRFYQSAIYLPVMLSLAIVGFIWQLVYSPEQGLLNNLLGRTEDGEIIDWLGDPDLNLWAVLIAASWRHVGYIMILYLAGLKSVDPSLREAAAIDGASGRQAFWHVIFPALRPVNVVVIVVSVIDSLRAFDIVYVINGGTNGLELLSVLVTNNIIGEASRIGFGSALAVILLLISLSFIIPYVRSIFREQR
ncbi:sugar ABC transporter permease [Streptomyces capparidis]